MYLYKPPPNSVYVLVLYVLLCFSTGKAYANNINNPTIYHVSVNEGNDNNAGTREKPFSSISKCAVIARPGDTCIIHQGVYGETIHPLRSGQSGQPITFTAGKGEKVRITGLDILKPDWNKVSSTVYTTKSRFPVKQLFFKDELMNISQFPNTDNYFNPSFATVSTAQCKTAAGTWSKNHKTCMVYNEAGVCSKRNNCWNRSFPKQMWRITSDSLPSSSQWRGGTIAIVNKQEYNAERATILHSDLENHIEFEWFYEKPIEPGLKFTITNSLAAIDKKNEWSYDADSQQLYINIQSGKLPDSIYIRTRELAFDLKDKEYINISGFEIFAASIETGPASHGCMLDNLDIKYPVYHQMYGATINFPGQGANRHIITSKTLGKGITLGGKTNTLKNSKIGHSWCDGVTVYGSNNTVENNNIYDVNWSMTACAAVSTNGQYHHVKNNLIHDCGRSCLWHQKTFDSEFSYNDISDACWLGKDCGITGSNAWFGKKSASNSDKDGDGTGNVFHHNWIHDNRSADGGACLYLDNNEQSYLIHHNVFWGCKIALILNDTYIFHGPTNHTVYNNTCFNVEYRISDYGSSSEWELKNVIFAHNLCTSSKDAHYNKYNSAAVTMKNNIGPRNANVYAEPTNQQTWTANDLKLMNISTRDFRPTTDSPASSLNRLTTETTESEEPPTAVGAYYPPPIPTWKAKLR